MDATSQPPITNKPDKFHAYVRTYEHANTGWHFLGEMPPTTGSAYLSGFDVRKNPEEIHRLVGYCPQFDALFETLTAREHLTMYAAIKASMIPLYQADTIVAIGEVMYLLLSPINSDLY